MSQRRWKNRLLAKAYGAFPSLAGRWGRGLVADSGSIPWAEPRKPLREATLALVTTGGVHRRDQPAFDMSDSDGDASWREISVGSARERLTITHDYYDHRDAERDLDLVAPARRLAELAAAGALGGLHPVYYSLMGHIDGAKVEVLRRDTAPEIAERLRRANVDYTLLVPA